MGEGEVAGEVMRGFGVVVWGAWGTLFAMAGEPPAFSEPKLMLGRLLEPLAIGPEVPAALIVMEEGLRPWAGAPLAMGGAPTAGTAGWIWLLPFTEPVFPCCAEPTATSGVLEAIAGGEADFFVAALAYDLAAG